MATAVACQNQKCRRVYTRAQLAAIDAAAAEEEKTAKQPAAVKQIAAPPKPTEAV